MNNNIEHLENGDFNVMPYNNISSPTNPSEFDRLKPIKTYNRIILLQFQIKDLIKIVNDLQLDIEKLKEDFLKGE